MPAVNSPQRVSWVNVLREAGPQVACEPGVTPEQREQTALGVQPTAWRGRGPGCLLHPPHPRALHQGWKQPASQQARCSRCGRKGTWGGASLPCGLPRRGRAWALTVAWAGPH